MSFYDTEAYHLSEMYDEGCYEPYSDSDKRDYLSDKAMAFKDKDKGKYVICQTPRKNKAVVPILYLVDRNKTREFWWSHDAEFAMLFDSKEAARIQMSKLKYNNNLRIRKV